MEKIQIEIPEGFEIDSLDKQSGLLKFKAKPKIVTERIKTIADVLSDNGLSPEKFNAQCVGLEEDEVAYRILKMLAKSLNEGWKPNWDNSNEWKYYAWFYMGGSSGFRFLGYVNWYTGTIVGSRLCFKSRELAEYAGKNFTDVYKQFMVIK